MRYRSFGKTGLRVSELSFGAMTFGRGLGSISKVDEPLAEEMIARAIDAGVNLFDTADVYSAGASEEMLGRALGKRRGDVLVATKVGFPSGSGVNERGLAYRRVVSAAEASLRRLGSDWIDLYHVHWPVRPSADGPGYPRSSTDRSRGIRPISPRMRERR